MKLLAMSLGCALALCAQEADQVVVQKQMADAKAQLAQTMTFVSGQMFGNPVKGQPYSAEAVTETTQTLADGNRIVNRNSTMIYRDSDGRERREETIGRLGNLNAEKGPAKVVFISDPVSKVSYTLHTNTHTAERHSAPPLPPPGGPDGKIAFAIRTGPADAAELMPPVIMEQRDIKREARGGNSKVEQLGTQVIEGIAAQGTRTTTTIPAGEIGNERDLSIVSERWYSQELGVVVM
ncbi:MAG TPA: hypothetical protein VMG40_11275, partial [Bryobacteraceae bacterium]|nr:hypothetical protein [Bryobacteraceae bacterium]